MLVLGGLNIICNGLYMVFMGGTQHVPYIDADGQQMHFTVSGNYMLSFALFKIILGALTLKQGQITKKVFKPIVKEYKDVEHGITQGIVMNKRRSKKMAHLKKKICRITVVSFVVGLLSLIYYSNFQMDMVDQYLD